MNDKLYIHQVTNSQSPLYGLWVVSFLGMYLHKDGVWRPLCDLDRLNNNGQYTGYWKDDEISKC